MLNHDRQSERRHSPPEEVDDTVAACVLVDMLSVAIERHQWVGIDALQPDLHFSELFNEERAQVFDARDLIVIEQRAHVGRRRCSEIL